MRMPVIRSVVSTVRPVRANRPAARESSGRRRNSRPAPRPPPPRSANPSRARTDFAPASRTTSTGFSRRSAGCVRSISRASQRNRSRSRAKARAMPGPQHLDRDLAPSVVAGEMHLGDRRRGDRRSRRTTRTARRAAARIRPRSARRASLAGKRRQPVLQPRQIGGDLLAEQIGAGRQDLAELDEARAQLAERRGEPLARPRRDAGRGGAPAAAEPQRAAPAPAIGVERRTARRAAPGSARSAPGARNCGGCGRARTPAATRVRAARPNAARRCRRSGCGT